jgi:hypothetical protein
VSSLSVFEATIEHDSIYALLAIAKDATPIASDEKFQPSLGCIESIFEVFSPRKQYKVEYEKPFVDAAGNFVQFCIKGSLYTDKTRALDIICRPWAPEGNARWRTPDVEQRNRSFTKESKATKFEPFPEQRDIPLPSWITRVSSASHSMWVHAGMPTLKMGRKNADSLVGLPTLAQRNYNAAETKAIDMKALRFRKRPNLGHYSLYVKGFELDTITEIYSRAQSGSIPSDWAKAAGWHRAPKTRPPDAFWRTLVASRGRDGANPPAYYSRACQDSFLKGGLMSGSVNTNDLINNERCSFVAQFCRRVQEVIWNKVLVKTRRGNLGLVGKDVQVGDRVCILYGCSVPVVLRKSSQPKSDEDINEEITEDLREWFKEFRRKSHDSLKRVEMFRQKRRDEKWKYKEWENKKRSQWLKDRDWRRTWKNNYLDRNFWEKLEARWASWVRQHSNGVEERERDDAWWNSWTTRRHEEKKALERIDAQELEMYHSLLDLELPKSPWMDVDKGWWEAWQRLKSKKLPKLSPGQPLGNIQNKSKSVCDTMLQFHFWRLEMARGTLPEDREFNQWKAEHCPRGIFEEEKEVWNEPSPNWSEFELFMRYGRRWKKHWQTKKTERSRDYPKTARLAELFRPSFELTHQIAWHVAQGRGKEGNSKAARLAELFRPPFELMYQVPWDVARYIGKEEKKWILVNVQDPTIFECQALNRNIWKHEGIKELVKEVFIFIQYPRDDPRNRYIQYYFPTKDNGNAYPYVAIVDPRTGKQVKLWSGPPVPTAEEFLMQLVEFLDRHSLEVDKRGNPVIVRKPEEAAQSDHTGNEQAENHTFETRKHWKDRKELMEWLREARSDYHSPYYYEFFGECYIHGMMDGEAMAVQNNEGIASQVFELR